MVVKICMSLKFKLETIDPGEFLLKALDGSTIKGIYSFSVEDSGRDDLKLVRGHVYVPQRFRGQSIGPRLIFRFGAEICNLAEKDEADYIHVVGFETPESRRVLSPIFSSFGYIEFETRKGKPNLVRQYLPS